MSVFKNILLIFILFLYSCTSNDQELTTNSQNEGSTNINLSQNKDMTKTEEASLTVQMVLIGVRKCLSLNRVFTHAAS